MKVYRLEVKIVLPIPLDEAWDFFANPENLALLTPKSMAFSNAFPLDAPRVYPGMLIVHRVSPLPMLNLTWVTEITHLENQVRFVDEQRKGPFALWHHIHTLSSVTGGTEVNDLLYYGLPFGPLGRLAHLFVVRKQIATIFAYRKTALKTMFGTI
jgi:ligand-binding SRPBCC domain-containing protein